MYEKYVIYFFNYHVHYHKKTIYNIEICTHRDSIILVPLIFN